MTFSTPSLRAWLLAGGLLFAPATFAQHGGGHGGGGMPGGGGFPGGGHGSDFPGSVGDPRGAGRPLGDAPDAPAGSRRGGLRLGPPGRWWDDKHYAKDLKLRPEQQRRMDAAFEENRGNLLRHYEALQEAEARLKVLTGAHSPDQTALYGQIDRVAQARADLEKANTHLLLQLRSEMDPDQVARLEQSR